MSYLSERDVCLGIRRSFKDLQTMHLCDLEELLIEVRYSGRATFDEQ